MTMIEKVARALYEYQRALGNVVIPSWEESVSLKNYWYDLARVAIEAMREPTEAAMKDCADDNSGAPYCADHSFLIEQWNKMIDAALG